MAYHVCAHSLIRHATRPVAITALALSNLSDYSETHADGSSQFIYSRFLAPHLMHYQGWAIFMDGDMLLRDDIVKLWELRDESKAVMVVKHNYQTRASSKCLGSGDQNYPRKSWSSVVLWNCAHLQNRMLTSAFVEHATGVQLHCFSWLEDELMGELPMVWSWLPGELSENAQAKLLH